MSTMADSGIKTHEDLKGKRVNLGQPGGLDQNSLNLLAAYGMTIKDIKPSVQGVGAGVDALKDGKFDAVITTIPLINQLLATHKITILWPDEAHIDKMVKRHPAMGSGSCLPATLRALTSRCTFPISDAPFPATKRWIPSSCTR